MAEVLSTPQFQVLTHQYTGEKTGRIYFPALFLAEFHTSVTKWLQQGTIIFDERDLKRYEDGSFRLYFQTTDEPEIAYFQLVKMAEKGFDYRQISQSYDGKREQILSDAFSSPVGDAARSLLL
jgi:hypothetical protein